MNEQELSRGLTALADQAPQLSVNVDDAITTAVIQAKRRRVVTAAAFSTTVVLAAAITLVTLNGSTAPPDLNPAAAPTNPPTKVRPSSTVPSQPSHTPQPPSPEQQRNLERFANHLTAVIPVVVPGVVTAEQTFGMGMKEGITVNFAALDKSSGGPHSNLQLMVVNAAQVAKGSQPLDRPCREITKPEPNYPDWVCYRQPDGSRVYLIEKEVARPGADDEAVRAGKGNTKAKIADHVRKDGSDVQLLNYSADINPDFKSQITDQQFIKLVTDPAFTQK